MPGGDCRAFSRVASWGCFCWGNCHARRSRFHAGVAVSIGVVLIAWMTLSPLIESVPQSIRWPLHESLTIVVGTTVIVVVGALIAKVASPPAEVSD